MNTLNWSFQRQYPTPYPPPYPFPKPYSTPYKAQTPSRYPTPYPPPTPTPKPTVRPPYTASPATKLRPAPFPRSTGAPIPGTGVGASVPLRSKPTYPSRISPFSPYIDRLSSGRGRAANEAIVITSVSLKRNLMEKTYNDLIPNKKKVSVPSNPNARGGGQISKINILAIKATIKAFYERKYGLKQNLIKDESDETGGMLEIKVEGIRNEVLREYNLWEKLKIYTLFYRTDSMESRVVIRVIVDGRASAGTGVRMPGDSDYFDLDRSYSQRLRDYANILLVAIKRELEGY